MRGYKQLAPLVADDDAIDIDQLVRDAASGVQADARARRTNTPDLTGGADDDLPYIPLDLDESEYTFQAPRIEPREFPARGEAYGTPAPSLGGFAPRTAPGFQSDGRMSVRGTARFGEHLRRTAEQALRNQPPASPSAPLASPPPAAQTAPGTTPQPPETQVAPQAQQAPAVAPPGQGGQPPAQDAAEEAPLSSVPTEGGNMRPEAAPMLTPMADRARKFAEAPGAFKPTGDEEARLADAQRLDDQGARRQRIARGILSGVGLLGAATGLNGLAGIGAAGLGATNAASRAPNERTNRVREEIARRMQGMQAEREAANQAATREAQGIESQRQAARQSRLDDANVGLTNARAASEMQDAATSELERATAMGDAAGMRAAIRATVNGLNDDSGLVQQWRALVASPEFDGMQGESLRAFSGQVAQLANNRRAGVLEGGGGHGPSGRMVQDPNTLQMRWQPGSSGRSGTAAQPVAPTGPAAPRRAPAGAPSSENTPSEGAVNEAASTPQADPRAVALNRVFPRLTPQERTIALGMMIDHGYTPEQLSDGRVQSVINAAVDRYRAAPAGAGDAQYGGAIEALARDIDPNRFGPGIDADIYRRTYSQKIEPMERDMAPLITVAQSLRRAIGRARTPDDQARLRAAISGNPAMAQMLGVPDLQAMLARGNEQYARERSGAAISPSEWESFRTQLGQGSVITNPQAIVNAFDQLIGLGRSHIDEVWTNAGGPNYVNEYLRRREQAAANRRAARGRR